ncbi:MAG: hypothetical protein ACKOW2_09630 [Sphingobacteriaceae bacterium]
MKKLALVLLGLGYATLGFAQKNVETLSDSTKNLPASIFKVQARDYSRKGKFYVHWGYNVSGYAKSDINFHGKGYNFTLKDVVAHDRPTALSSTYINPATISIPQFNFHFGYFIKDNYSISLGWDHMKYVVDVPQTVKITGYIEASISEPAIATGAYEGVYDNDDFTINHDFLKYEHTDGYNYASVEVERYDDAWKAKNGTMYLTMETGLGAGLVIPRTDVRLLGVGQNNFWNVAGWGVSAKAGLKLFFNKHLFFQGSLKTGWTDLSNIRTTGRDSDHAKQKISYLENYWVLGYLF